VALEVRIGRGGVKDQRCSSGRIIEASIFDLQSLRDWGRGEEEIFTRLEVREKRDKREEILAREGLFVLYEAVREVVLLRGGGGPHETKVPRFQEGKDK
jgi:hypothetical protein